MYIEEENQLSEIEIQYETERNKPMPSKNHSIIQLQLGAALLNKYSKKYNFFSELSLELPDVKPSVPDISIFPKSPVDLMADEIKVKEPPLSVIEILSPKQGIDDLKEKFFKIYFPAGVKSAWLIIPKLRVVYIFTPDKKYVQFSSGELHDPVSDISLELDSFFP